MAVLNSVGYLLVPGTKNVMWSLNCPLFSDEILKISLLFLDYEIHILE